MKPNIAGNPSAVVFKLGKSRFTDIIDSIQTIRGHRNYMILNLLTGSHLTEYLFFHFRIRKISEEQIACIRKELFTYTYSQLDMMYYSELIRKLKDQPVVNFPSDCELFFHCEIEALIKNALD